MKRQFLVIPIIFILFSLFFITPGSALAASCPSQDGYCEGVIFNCRYGGSIPNDSCWPGFKCCPNRVGNPNQTDGVMLTSTDGTECVNTAIGCINVGSGTSLVETILRIATGLGGGLALALILYGVFIVTTSAGMPDKLKAGSEIITSAVIGLIFILLSVFLVNLIGINILGIPGLT
jgi:hypothetical protein